VRRIDTEAIFRLLEERQMVSIGGTLFFQPTGEVFNLKSEDVAIQAAIQLKADKLINLLEEKVC